MRKAIKVLTVIFGALLVCLLLLISVLLIYSPGKIKPYTDKDGNTVEGSISEKVFLNIGGVRQGMFIRGRDINNPVLLYIHGGPAFPNYFLIDKYTPGLEEFFTVCYWEQRGGGLSYSSEVTPESMTFGQLVSDAIEVTNYLRNRFGKEKIYILAHSGGTPIGILAASQMPHLYHAYVGMAQTTRQMESEILAYKYMTEQFTASGNTKAVEELREYNVLQSDSCVTSFYKSMARDKYMHELGVGTMRGMNSVFSDIFIPVWTCRAYTLREKYNIWVSKFSFIRKTNLINELLTTDFTEKVTKLEIPVYFFGGKYDMTVNTDLSKAYLEKLQAPVKGFYTFNESAHSPIYEEPQRVREILVQDVLNHTTNLADKK